MKKFGIFFDLDGTLVYTTSSREERFVNLAQKTGLSPTLQEVKKAYRYADKWWAKQRKKLSDRTRHNFIQLNYILLKKLGVDSNTKDFAQKITKFWEETPWSKAYPEADVVLKSLQERGYKLGILSHRSPVGIKRATDWLGWQDYFECFISPVDAKAPRGKKDHRMWEYGLKKVGLPKSKVLHVGDEYKMDVMRAAKMGILPILIDREERYAQKELPCLVKNNLNEVLTFLGIEIT